MTLKSSNLLFSAIALLALAACAPSDDASPTGEAPDAAAGQPVPAEAASAEEAHADAADTLLPRSPAPADARVYFVTPEDGAIVTSPVKIEFGIEGMEVVTAGTEKAKSGHHHLLVDTGLPAADQPIPADDQHVHFGDGSTATELELEPGEHRLQLLLGDHLHIPHEPPVTSDVITIKVQ